MKASKKLVSFLLVLTMLCSCFLTGCADTTPVYNGDPESEYKVAMITDAGDITDQSFNQTTYEACEEYCSARNIPFTYKKPDGDTDYARIAMIDVAVAEGYNIIVMSGYIFAAALVEVTYKYPDVKFIVLDMTEGDIIAAAVGGAYYDNPDAYDGADYYNKGNTYCAVYREELVGFMAGYAAVKLGYKNLGYLGGQSVPPVMRFGYGYVQGINQAAEELGIADEVNVEYAYGGQFYGSTEITAAMDTWYSKGTEIVFACGGGIFTSVAEAAAKTGGKVIGVDSDQSPIIDAYGVGMTVTSAMKGLKATIFAMLDSIIYDNTWEEHVGKVENLGLVSGTDTSLNYLGLPEDTTQWNENFTLDDYHELVRKLFEGEIKVDPSTEQVPEVSVHLNMREGSIV
ncbi:MAG: BMP family ABC transporter substrate-binding protein [Lachnospiraceae bacterium]|nr:BMP family ABC transporter substrate-binding protein [Lachnospiraceae bacterium]